jgi:hypothetical protein
VGDKSRDRMTFDVTADAYARFMGQYADPLAEQFVASFQADSTASPPPLVKNTRFRSPGA